MTGDNLADLADRARRLGIADRYHGFWGKEEHVAPSVLERAIRAMGDDAVDAAPPGLPAVHVVREGEAPVLRWSAHAGVATTWRAVRDDGGAEVAAGDVQQDNGELRIHLPADLQPDYYRITVDGIAEQHCLLVVAPRSCWVAPGLQGGERWWGCTVQLYALRSSRNWGIGDFGDLRRLADAAAHQGASFIGLNPLHALFPHNPAVASPYSPSSRRAFNPVYLDVQTLVDLGGCDEALERVQSEAFQDRLRALRETEMVDYVGVAVAKEEVLRLLWRHFERNELNSDRSRGNHFLRYMQERQQSLGPHALFEAIQAHLHAADPNVWGWPAWPDDLRDPQGAGAQAFAQEHADEVRYRFWLQWLCELQLEACQRYAKTRGMGIGLYCDLAVGLNGGGSETWTESELFALGMHAGAP
ncbi:MAG: 4-alpha-glucanotransferase, partial [Comamonadaceae bacterium]